MGLDANLYVVTPDGTEELFYFSKGSGSLHQLIVEIASGGSKEKRKSIFDKGECKLSLEQCFELIGDLNELLDNPHLQKSLEFEDGQDEKFRGRFNDLEYHVKKINKTLINLFYSVHEGELDSNFIYFKYDFS